jgi:hypothetical protein
MKSIVDGVELSNRNYNNNNNAIVHGGGKDNTEPYGQVDWRQWM